MTILRSRPDILEAESMHKVFITYHHEEDQEYKEALLALNDRHKIFIDKSVDTGDISDELGDQPIRRMIRDNYLRDSTVTILLVGASTWGRKHVDWELYSSMIDGSINKKSGILVVNLPSSGTTFFTASHGGDEKSSIHPECVNWVTVSSRAEYERRYPAMPARIIDNLLASEAYVSVVPWEKAFDPQRLRVLINLAFDDRQKCKYDLSRAMRRRNA